MKTYSLARDGLPVCVPAAAAVLRAGGLVVGPTDTLYGIFSAWASTEALKRVYAVKGRDQEKRLLALAARADMLTPWVSAPVGQIRNIHVAPDTQTSCLQPTTELARLWPGALTLVLPARDHPFGWETIAFRVPDNEFVRALSTFLGEPLYAPSANPQGSPPARTCEEAQQYFGNAIDMYIDGGEARDTVPSTLVSCLDSPPKVLRQGAMKIS